MKSNGGESAAVLIFGALSPGGAAELSPAGGEVRGQWAAAMAWIPPAPHHHHHLNTLTTFNAHTTLYLTLFTLDMTISKPPSLVLYQ